MCHVRVKISSKQEGRKEGRKEKEQSLSGNKTRGGQPSLGNLGNGVNLGESEWRGLGETTSIVIPSVDGRATNGC